MRRVYGLRAANEQDTPGLELETGPFIRRFGENHEFEYKRVPLVTRDGHLYSNVASPQESSYVKKKLLNKQRKDQALEIQKVE